MAKLTASLLLVTEPTELANISRSLQGSDKAELFTNAGPVQAEIIGNVIGNRALLTAGLDVSESDALAEVLRRLKTPREIVEVASNQAPVHQVILEGDDTDLTKLPVPFQPGLDGGPYISASIDYTRDADTGWTNVGIRRLMLRGRRETGIDAGALSRGPRHFGDLMNAVGSRDGREVVLELDELRQAGKLVRNEDGKYALV